jgi:hypothetical protein
MADVGYGIQTGGAVALTAATAKSVLGIKSGSAFGVMLRRITVGFDGVTSSAVPVLVELCYSTFATNAPGTASTSVTPVQEHGRVLTHGVTAAKTWTTEPTVLTTLGEYLIPPTSGFDIWYPFGQEPESALAEGYVIRCTAPAAVNVRAQMDYRRC